MIQENRAREYHDRSSSEPSIVTGLEDGVKRGPKIRRALRFIPRRDRSSSDGTLEAIQCKASVPSGDPQLKAQYWHLERAKLETKAKRQRFDQAIVQNPHLAAVMYYGYDARKCSVPDFNQPAFIELLVNQPVRPRTFAMQALGVAIVKETDATLLRADSFAKDCINHYLMSKGEGLFNQLANAIIVTLAAAVDRQGGDPFSFVLGYHALRQEMQPPNIRMSSPRSVQELDSAIAQMQKLNQANLGPVLQDIARLFQAVDGVPADLEEFLGTFCQMLHHNFSQGLSFAAERKAIQDDEAILSRLANPLILRGVNRILMQASFRLGAKKYSVKRLQPVTWDVVKILQDLANQTVLTKEPYCGMEQHTKPLGDAIRHFLLTCAGMQKEEFANVSE